MTKTLPKVAVQAIESAINRKLTGTEKRALRNREAVANAIKDVPGSLQVAESGQVMIRGGTTSGSPGQLVRFWNKWRENYNALVGLTIARVRALNEQTQRGDHAYPQWTYRTIERRHPVLKALIDSCEEPIENFKWDVRIKPNLPAGYTEEQAEAQQTALKAAYAQVDNIQEAITHLSHADFRGFAHVQKWRVAGLFDQSGNLRPGVEQYAYLADRPENEVFHLECLHTFCWSRDGLFGDWFWNPDSRSLTAPEYVLTNNNRVGGDVLPRADFIIREVERPIDEIALENYVRRKLIEKDWSAFDEIFGIPSGVITMPPNIPPGKESEYEVAAKNVAEGGNGAIPNGATYTANDQPRDGSNLFKNHMDKLDEDLVLAGTGGKLTMLVEKGQGDKRGSSGTQENIFWQIMFGRGSKCAQAMHRDFDIPFLAENFPGQPPLVEFCLVTEDEVDITSLCTNIATLKSAGKNVSTDWLADQTGYEFEEDDAAPAPAAGLPNESGDPTKELDEASDAPGNNADAEKIRNRDQATIAATLHETLLPLLTRLEAISKIEDAGIQQAMLEKLLKDFPQIADAIKADDSLAKKLSPLLEREMWQAAQPKRA